MTESAHDKTKRKLLSVINTIKPTHQTAIFFNNFDDGVYINDVLQKIKKPASAAFKHITMIWVLRTKYQPKYGTVGYIQILTTETLDLEKLDKVLNKHASLRPADGEIRTTQREFSYEDYTNTLSKQKLANLAAYLSTERSPRRYATTNKPRS